MYVVGMVTAEEKALLEKGGWEVEPGEKYSLVGSGENFLIDPLIDPAIEERSLEVVVIWLDTDIVEVMKLLSGPDWPDNEEEQVEESGESDQRKK